MKKDYAERIVAAMVDDWSGEEFPEIREDYSGRGMYGKTTTAVICASKPSFLEAICNVALEMGREDADNGDEFCRAMGKVAFDQMGRDSIVIY